MELRATVLELKELQRIVWSLQGLQLRPSKNDFNKVVYQFLETGTLDKTFMGRDRELK